ncbi:MAG: hypothetical protein Q9223_002982 [Gallowayella weberi]
MGPPARLKIGVEDALDLTAEQDAAARREQFREDKKKSLTTLPLQDSGLRAVSTPPPGNPVLTSAEGVRKRYPSRATAANQASKAVDKKVRSGRRNESAPCGRESDSAVPLSAPNQDLLTSFDPVQPCARRSPRANTRSKEQGLTSTELVVPTGSDGRADASTPALTETGLTSGSMGNGRSFGSRVEWNPRLDHTTRGKAIPQVLSAQLTTCETYRQRYPYIRDVLPMSDDAKDALQHRQDEICWFFGNMSILLPEFWLHVDRFSVAFINQINVTQTHAQRAMANGSRQSLDVLVEQNILNEQIPNIMAMWGRNIKIIQGPGVYISQEMLSHGRSVIADQHAGLVKARRLTSMRAQKALAGWSLARRVARTLGLLRMEPEELEPFSEAIEVLDDWIAAIHTEEVLIVVLQDNVTEVNHGLNSLASAVLSDDLRAQLGTGGLMAAHVYLQELEQKSRDLQRTRRNQNAEQLVEADTDESTDVE